MKNRRDSSKKRISDFLALRDFDEYMENLARLSGIPREGKAFYKEMTLMESDGIHTRREKDRIRNRKIRDIIREFSDEITLLMDETEKKGVYRAGPGRGRKYNEVSYRYPDAKFQYQAGWLYGQRLDIYIPSKKVAIEYQGRQHTEAVDFFGAERGLMDNIERDMRKRQLCDANGVQLIYWNYDDPLTKEFFEEHIDKYIRHGQTGQNSKY